MDPLIYTVMSGASRTQQALQIRANNIANAQTDGFRADMQVAQASTVPGFGYDARHQTLLAGHAVSTHSGVLDRTGRELDAAIEGDGYFAVQDGGGEAYTRSGHFQIDAEGQLLLDGRMVLGEGGPIMLPEFSSLGIGADGTISVTTDGESQAETVDKLKLVTAGPGGVLKTSTGLLVSADGAELPASDTVQVKGGHLERSNVSPVEEMVATMSLQRDFEMMMRMYKSADEMADAGNRLMRG
ncbi:flagellar basal body rod protein FlgF [Chromobacterium haemolyticum]|uniref:flagellar basal body rod protein FlgF n=1 Tax=Chromobacterium haemolyticum TaxID=394935 RepID=UPI0009D958E3|nr:flagellar basal body rod protein FlgF [Chromobacterium haemolyticum]OQS33863.1 flagellar biosynthesis protein FlgF [Chromobacterium haemolyticum]